MPALGGGNSDSAPAGWWHRYGRRAATVIGALGILGAIGSRVVDFGANRVAERVDDAKSPTLVSVREDPQGGSDGFRVAMRSVAGLEPKLRSARDCDHLFVAAKHAGAVDVDQSITGVILEGRTRRDLTIVDMRAHVLRREPPLRGAVVLCSSAGAEDAIGVAFNLDERDPVARTITNDFRTGRPYFERGKVVTLKKAELQPLAVYGQTSRYYVEWVIEAEAIVDGKKRTITITNNGRPFRLTARPPANDYAHFFEWVWYEEPNYLYSSTQAKEEKAEPAAQSRPQLDPPPGTIACGKLNPSEWVGPTASCAFAQNVRRAYKRTRGGNVTLTVYSPVTGKTYSVSCTAGRPHACTSDTGAVVYLR